ncbi:MAG TPA: nuclear transport factor 2 family protein [Stellaceae bacterium]|jgi:ketosteroid isomerase-like protein|nr:nuclear transport factor 2 family protein [Stellaceae bacterium]
MAAPAMDPEKLAGGTPEDRRRVLDRMHDYLDVNARFDWEALQDLWSAAPEAVFFNLNGHTYKGREHWTRLWQFYQNNVKSSYWTPFDVGGVLSGDLAVVWCERHAKSEWVGADPVPEARQYALDFISRSTMVFRKEDGDWRCVHVHFSQASTAPRPGSV